MSCKSLRVSHSQGNMGRRVKSSSEIATCQALRALLEFKNENEGGGQPVFIGSTTEVDES